MTEELDEEMDRMRRRGIRALYLAGIVAVLGIIFLSTALGVVTQDAHRREDQLKERLSRTRDYCAAVAAALEIDARDLESGDPSRRAEAGDRFAGLTTYHSEPEILLCSSTPPDLTRRDQCWLAHDYSCLAKLARAAAASTKGFP